MVLNLGASHTVSAIVSITLTDHTPSALETDQLLSVLDNADKVLWEFHIIYILLLI